jgi:hypothetical protein
MKDANCGASMKPQQNGTKSVKMNAGGMAMGGTTTMGGGIPGGAQPTASVVGAPTKYPKRADMAYGGMPKKKSKK